MRSELKGIGSKWIQPGFLERMAFGASLISPNNSGFSANTLSSLLSERVVYPQTSTDQGAITFLSLTTCSCFTTSGACSSRHSQLSW